MLAQLFAAAIAFVTVWENPHTGEPTYIQWCRATGDCAAEMQWVVENIERASREQDVDPWEIMTLGETESMLNVRVKSKIGAHGLLQLHPAGKVSIKARKECRAAKMTRRECDAHIIDVSVEFYKLMRDECGSLPRTFYAWRTGECGRGPYSNKTYRKFLENKRKYDNRAPTPFEQNRWSLRYAASTHWCHVSDIMCFRTDV